MISRNSKCFQLYSSCLKIKPGKLIFFLKPTLTCSRAKLSCDLSYLAFHHMSHTASVTWHDVIYCMWLVLYIIWISQLTCVKCPLPPKMCCLASSWFASCLSNCAPMFFQFTTFWNHQFNASEECSIEICYSPHGAESVSYFWIMQRHRPHVPQLLNSFLISFSSQVFCIPRGFNCTFANEREDCFRLHTNNCQLSTQKRILCQLSERSLNINIKVSVNACGCA